MKTSELNGTWTIQGNGLKFFIVGNRYGQKMWELLCSKPFPTFEAAQAMAAKLPTTWNATIVNTPKEKANEST